MSSPALAIALAVPAVRPSSLFQVLRQQLHRVETGFFYPGRDPKVVADSALSLAVAASSLGCKDLTRLLLGIHASKTRSDSFADPTDQYKKLRDRAADRDSCRDEALRYIYQKCAQWNSWKGIALGLDYVPPTPLFASCLGFLCGFAEEKGKLGPDEEVEPLTPETMETAWLAYLSGQAYFHEGKQPSDRGADPWTIEGGWRIYLSKFAISIMGDRRTELVQGLRTRMQKLGAQALVGADRPDLITVALNFGLI